MLFSIRRLASSPIINKYSRSCRAYSGLLSGINSVEEIKHSKFYAASLNIEETAEFMEKNKYLYETAKRDVANPTKENVDQYIYGIERKADEFILKKEVWGCEEIKQQLESVFQEKGQFVCLLGGKSCGKSLLLSEINKQKDHWSVLVDMYSGVPLIKTLNHELRKSLEFVEFFNTHSPSMAAATDATLGIPFFGKLKAIMQEPNNASTPEQSYERDLEIFNDIITFITFFNGNVTIFINDAKNAFDTTDKSSENIKAIKRDLDFCLKLTRDTKAVNIVLVSGEHSFPYKLEAFEFKTTDFSKFLFMGEVPPDKMYELLTEKWGMRENLAIAFMEFYGGHVYDCSRAIDKLAYKKKDFRADVASTGAHQGIIHTLFEFRGTDHEKKAKEYLSALATHGFVFTSDTLLKDPVAQCLSDKNVAGMTTRDCITVGLPDTVWTGSSKYGLIPDKQSLRMLIARCHKKLE